MVSIPGKLTKQNLVLLLSFANVNEEEITCMLELLINE